ncbi:MAG: CxxxxCH/CxxCH domain-containing protein [Bdellovibrionota bacterium]
MSKRTVTTKPLLFVVITLQSCLQSNIGVTPTDSDILQSPACATCHGSSENAAPPNDTQGRIDPSLISIGAHQAHLVEGPYRIALACNDCHLVPTSIDAVGHIDSDLPAEVIFGELANIRGANPEWNGNSCSDVYCHGSALSGGSNNTPVWNMVDGSQAACGTCHGLPPGPPHTTDTDCHTCHAEVVNDRNEIINKTLHINGEVNVTGGQTCTSCHGTTGVNNAPPFDTSGNTATSFRGVGASSPHGCKYQQQYFMCRVSLGPEPNYRCRSY